MGKSAIHAIVGTDDGEIKSTAARLAVELAPPDGGEFGVDTIDGNVENAEQGAAAIHRTIDALLTVPFFGGGKLVWLKSATCFADSVIGRAAAVVEASEKLAELLKAGLPPNVTFLLSAVGIDKRRSFYKTLSKAGEVRVFDRLDTSRSGWEDAAVDAAAARAGERGMKFTSEALQLLALLTGGNSGQLESELEKLDLFRGEFSGPIDADTVRKLVPRSRAGVIFELGNAVAARQVPRAMRMVRTLLDQGESAIGILLVALVPTVRNLLLAKDLSERYRLGRNSGAGSLAGVLKKLPDEATSHLPRKKDGGLNVFPLSIAMSNVHRFSMAELKELMGKCLQANLELVTTQLDAEVVLSKVVAGLARKGVEAASARR